jgi:hypothetical protein
MAFRSVSPNRVETWHEDGCPRVIIRGILYHTDVGDADDGIDL